MRSGVGSVPVDVDFRSLWFLAGPVLNSVFTNELFQCAAFLPLIDSAVLKIMGLGPCANPLSLNITLYFKGFTVYGFVCNILVQQIHTI